MLSRFWAVASLGPSFLAILLWQNKASSPIVGIAHRGDTEYLKSIPDCRKNNSLGNLPSVSSQS